MLEVLAGLRTPTEAAQALEVGAQRYYLLEARALAGLLAACEPRGRGPVRSAEKALAESRKECQKLRQQVSRYQALARASQRTVGISAPVRPKSRVQGQGKGRGKRRPVVRALRAIEGLKRDLEGPQAPAASAEAAEGGPAEAESAR
ncbi:MAG: hypothetical protein V3U28_11420 [Candidatus Acidoferrales bacterium]